MTAVKVMEAQRQGAAPSGDRLRVALVAPPWFEIPPRRYGGIEAMCHWLAEGLAARGHEVTLIASGQGRTSARFVQTLPEPPSERLGESLPEILHATLAGRALQDLDVDVVHDHSLAGPVLAFGRSVPTVVTAHGPVDGELGHYYASLPSSVRLVAISEAQRRRAPHLSWGATVYNGIPVLDYPFSADKDDFALFLGRISPEKGPHLAIDACRQAGIDLVIAAKCNEPSEREFFDAEIRPRLGPDVEYVGEVGGAFKTDLLTRARCLVFPIQWEEPFGLVMVEAMACGTPVVALSRGSVPEVVADGISGFVCQRFEDLPDAIDRVDFIAPSQCRAQALRFDVSRMVLGYERVFAAAARDRDAASVFVA